MTTELTAEPTTELTAGMAGRGPGLLLLPALMPAWLGAGTPPPGAEKLELLVSWATWIATALCGIGFVIIGTRLALSVRRGETGEHVARLGAAAVGVVIVGAAAQIVDALL
jgi:hypothetical protein